MNGASARNIVRSTKSIVKATRELVRDCSDTAVAMCYCRRIAAELSSLPPVKLSDAGTKLFVRQWKLRHCVRWFVVSTRVDYWFRFSRCRKQHLLYD